MNESPPPADEPELYAEAVPRPPQLACPYCKSVDITHGLRLETSEGRVGIDYYPNTEPKGLLKILGGRVVDREELFVQLCRQCGTVARAYVECVHQNWKTK